MEERISINKAQIAFFFTPDTAFKSMGLAMELSKEFENIFDTEPNIISVPINSPVDIPRIVFGNSKNSNQLAISFSRSDFSIELNGNEHWDKDIITLSEKLGKIFIDKNKLKIYRIGMVLYYNINHEYTIHECQKEFISSTKLDGSEELNIAWLKKVSLSGLTINYWTRIFLSASSDNNSLIIDLNTLPEEVLNTSANPIAKVIKAFIDYTKGEVKNVIK